MKLIVITHYEGAPNEAEKINDLFDAGLELLHIRKPTSLKSECFELLEAINPQYHPKIKLHDYFDFADHYPILGVHLNFRGNVYRGRRKVNISKSCHTIEELDHISEYDYVFLSPIFDSISKRGYLSKFTPEMIRKASKEGKINEKVIALGGINEKTLPLLKGQPWGGAAVMSAVWNAKDPVATFLKLKSLL